MKAGGLKDEHVTLFGFEGAVKSARSGKEEYAPLAQLVEQLTLNQWVPVRVREGAPWPVGQVVKTAASHAVNIGSNPVRVTKLFLTKCGKDNIMMDVLREDRKTEVGAD